MIKINLPYNVSVHYIGHYHKKIICGIGHRVDFITTRYAVTLSQLLTNLIFDSFYLIVII